MRNKKTTEGNYNIKNPERNLPFMRQFNQEFPIRNTLRTELSWRNYHLLMRVLNLFEENIKQGDDNPTIRLILVIDKGEDIANYSVLIDNGTCLS